MRHTGRLVSASAAVVLAFATALPAPVLAGKRDTRSARVVDVSNIPIDNFGRINPHYYRGEQPEGRDYEDLAALGIRTVIDLQKYGDNVNEERLVEEAGMTFVRIPMTTHVPPTPEQVELFLGIVNDPARQPVYVHCKGGKHRTGVMTAVYRMEHDGWTAKQAFKDMKEYEFGWDFLHLEFKQFVYDYQPRRSVIVAGAQQAASSRH